MKVLTLLIIIVSGLITIQIFLWKRTFWPATFPTNLVDLKYTIKHLFINTLPRRIPLIILILMVVFVNWFLSNFNIQ